MVMHKRWNQLYPLHTPNANMACYTAQPTTTVIRTKQLILFLSFFGKASSCYHNFFNYLLLQLQSFDVAMRHTRRFDYTT